MEPAPAKPKRGMSTRVVVAPSVAAGRPASNGATEQHGHSDRYAATRQAASIPANPAAPLPVPRQAGRIAPAPSWPASEARLPSNEPLFGETVLSAPPLQSFPPIAEDPAPPASFPTPHLDIALSALAIAGNVQPTEVDAHLAGEYDAHNAVGAHRGLQSDSVDDVEGGSSQQPAPGAVPAAATRAAARPDALTYFQDLPPQEEGYSEDRRTATHPSSVNQPQAAHYFGFGQETSWPVQPIEAREGNLLDYDPEGQATADLLYPSTAQQTAWSSPHLQATHPTALQKDVHEQRFEERYSMDDVVATELQRGTPPPITEDYVSYNVTEDDARPTSSVLPSNYPNYWPSYPSDYASSTNYHYGESGFSTEDAAHAREEDAEHAFGRHLHAETEAAITATEDFDYSYQENLGDQRRDGQEGQDTSSYNYDGYEGWTGDYPQHSTEGAEAAYYSYPQDEVPYDGVYGTEGANNDYVYSAGTYTDGGEYLEGGNDYGEEGRGGGEYEPSLGYGGNLYDESSTLDETQTTEPSHGRYHMPIPSQSNVQSAEGSPSGASQSSDQRIVRFSSRRSDENTAKHLQVWERFFENAFALRQQEGAAANSPLVVSFTSSFARKFFTLAIPAHPAVKDIDADNPVSRAQRSLHAVEEGWRVLVSASRYQSLLRLAQATQRTSQQDTSKGAAVRALALYASVITGDASALKTLLMDGSELDLIDERSRGLVHYAAKNNQFQVLSLLFEGNIELDQRDTDHNTALHIAAALNRPKVVTFLLNCAADASLRNQEGFTPSELAYYLGHHDVVQLMQDHETGVTDVALDTEKMALENSSASGLVSTESAAQLPTVTSTPAAQPQQRYPTTHTRPSTGPSSSVPVSEDASNTMPHASLEESHAQLQSLKHKYRIGSLEEDFTSAKEPPRADKPGLVEDASHRSHQGVERHDGNKDGAGKGEDEDEGEEEEEEDEQSLSSMLSDRLAEKIWALAHYLISLALLLLFAGPTSKKKKKAAISAIQEPKEFSETESVGSSPVASLTSRAPPTDTELRSLGFKDPPQDVLLAVAMARANAQKSGEDTNQYSLGGAEGQLPPGTKWRYVPYHPTHGP